MSREGENWRVRFSDNSEADIQIVEERSTTILFIQGMKCGVPSLINTDEIDFLEHQK